MFEEIKGMINEVKEKYPIELIYAKKYFDGIEKNNQIFIKTKCLTIATINTALVHNPKFRALNYDLQIF